MRRYTLLHIPTNTQFCCIDSYPEYFCFCHKSFFMGQSRKDVKFLLVKILGHSKISIIDLPYSSHSFVAKPEDFEIIKIK